MNPRPPEVAMHPRNPHREGYDFAALVRACPELAPMVRPNPYGVRSIDFADPRAVLMLNRALLAHHYGVRGWELPEGYLCPPIPGRADYLHHLADLLAEGRGEIPRGAAIRVLDLGTGANLIYPLLGCHEYGWSFVATDIDDQALASARKILQANPDLAVRIELRRQPDRRSLFAHIIREGERFDATLCNPPFHASAREAREGSARKWRNLGKSGRSAQPTLNFGGHAAELWCEGGEAGFLQRMAEESARFAQGCRWFTCLVSKSANLPAARAALKRVGALEVRTVPMAQGQKQSRFMAWTFRNS